MEKIIVVKYRDVKLKSPILIGGLPGIGNVGKIAADYIVEKLNMVKIYDIFSEYLPPQVFINDDSEIHLVRNSIYYKKMRGKHDLLVLGGDFQGTTQEAQYELSYKMLELAKDMNVSEVYTLGGYSVGKIVERPRVLGAVTDKKLIPELEKNGVIFPKGEPGGGIVGSAGLILGLGMEIFKINGACLMGETSGYFADPKSAMEVLNVLQKQIGIKIDMSDIETRSKQIEQITGKMQEEFQNKQGKEDLGYFG
ncbi:hypothetical protein [Thermoplasma volcanium GSS1]|uniref:Proteasome assembly chaperone family protein n=1 Tax=Thermoplasma volcanium (strain ATCC 51530 / DSM 4299 / JCM 9571 / NBRC 15438 / GSS1) TaxID=273116 RepID=Q97BP3_THEVO|nr:proteasome assembly chaperone family protein [Thermoplasma volcanium]BAB59554.1 hypothetical protein [Thermoplasma volcanium GSS1]